MVAPAQAGSRGATTANQKANFIAKIATQGNPPNHIPDSELVNANTALSRLNHIVTVGDQESAPPGTPTPSSDNSQPSPLLRPGSPVNSGAPRASGVPPHDDLVSPPSPPHRVRAKSCLAKGLKNQDKPNIGVQRPSAIQSNEQSQGTPRGSATRKSHCPALANWFSINRSRRHPQSAYP